MADKESKRTVLNTAKQTTATIKTACVPVGLIAVFLLAFSSVSLAGTFVALAAEVTLLLGLLALAL